MKNYLLILLALFIVFSCTSPDNNPKQIKKVTIRSNGVVSSTYSVDSTTNKLVTSEQTDSYGIKTTRNYFYSKDSNDLVKVTKYNKIEGTGIVYIDKSLNRSTNQVVEETKRVVTATNKYRGSSENIYSVKYVYDESGKLVGIIQTDKYGNIISRDVEK